MSQSPSPSVFTSFLRWLRLKNYQYEVTFALYMLTPTEKFIFNTLLLLIVSMFVIAAYVYLPNHVVTVCNRIWYYWAGDPFSSDFSFVGYDMLMDKVKMAAVKTATATATAAVGSRVPEL
ncbi:hypothetical protein AJ80_04892 [Polytolypa hystricis UAMH7299]|uniref:Uncharacterized protein n=1 Tax=Polytolypa hystricis (strain UAMH7299) TaxID=1447883 RepID=A0A2B7Y7R5_POLH7|nr:hypothetical protein AJ80_04892 [Polytolypa hystricis UAMH7299]